MARPRSFRPEDLPIPEDARPHRTWPPIMLEMAAHIGPYDTLRIVDAFAGQDVYVPKDERRSPFRDIVGPAKVAVLASIYARQRIPIPVARGPLLRARRQGIIAAIRVGQMTVAEGAAILRMNRRHVSRLINQTDEGLDTEPALVLPSVTDPRQLDMFADIFTE